MNPTTQIVIGVATVAGVVVVAVLALYLYRNYERVAQRSLDLQYADLQYKVLEPHIETRPNDARPGEVRPGEVILTYHTYHGFIAWYTQTTHHVSLPVEDARILLGRLLRFNLKWGLVTPGVFLIYPLVIINYFVQRRAITRQLLNGHGCVRRKTG